MPIISSFFGIVIRMYYRDHAPPHFHAEYGGRRGTFRFDGVAISGDLRSRTALRLIRKWADLHRQELERNWARAMAGRSLDRIDPLE